MRKRIAVVSALVVSLAAQSVVYAQQTITVPAGATITLPEQPRETAALTSVDLSPMLNALAASNAKFDVIISKLDALLAEEVRFHAEVRSTWAATVASAAKWFAMYVAPAIAAYVAGKKL